jgi:hypothetical protein
MRFYPRTLKHDASEFFNNIDPFQTFAGDTEKDPLMTVVKRAR